MYKNNNKKIIITAGPTIEYIDPIRYISNRSSGTMGYFIAEAMRDKGFRVILVSGPVSIEDPEGIKVIRVQTAEEMNKAVKKEIKRSDCIIASAAVSDFKAGIISKQKIKKKNLLTLKLVKNVDILAQAKGHKKLRKIGFALESEHVISNGKKKMKEKGLDMIVVNKISKTENPFGPDIKSRGRSINRAYDILYSDGTKKRFKGITKKKMAAKIAIEAEKLLGKDENK